MICNGENPPTHPWNCRTSSKGFSVITFLVKLDWFSTMLPDWPEDSVETHGQKSIHGWNHGLEPNFEAFLGEGLEEKPLEPWTSFSFDV